ncbi:MAG: ATP-binding protein [bacterium]
MIAFEIFFLATLFLAAGLGVFVYLNNSRRTTNQFYLVVSVFITLWLAGNWYTLNSLDAAWAKLSIQASLAFAVVIPLACHLLRLSVMHNQEHFFSILYRSRFLLLTTLAFMGMCFTRFVISDVIFCPGLNPSTLTMELPEPVYGPGFLVYVSYFTLCLASLLVLYVIDRKKLNGAQRIEMEFIALGTTCGLLIGVAFGLIAPVVIGSSRSVPVSNAISIIVFTGIIAYGIATRRIMGVAHILQRVIAHGLLVFYLGGLYLLVLEIATSIQSFTPFPAYLANFIAAMVTVFAMAPARGRLRVFVDRLFQGRSLDVAGTIQEATRMLQSLVKRDEMLKDFANFISKTFNSENVRILLADRGLFREANPNNIVSSDTSMKDDNPLIQQLKESRDSCSVDMLLRFPLTPRMKEVLHEMEVQEVSLAMGLYFKGNMNGILLISARNSGQMYDRLDQDTLQILCRELGVAIENARLYNQVQDDKIYNDILLDNIVSGIIAVDISGVVTVFNREAQRLTQLAGQDVLNQPLDRLPAIVATAFRSTLADGHGLRDADVALSRPNGIALQVRMGTSVFCGHTGSPLGALMVLHDQTAVRQLEAQIRRNDRLASVGTLAASMAHEVKNPLVALKTFAQLLPTRYEDPDFRTTFSSLVGQEVTRIDAIVNQLLNFSRPAQPSLKPLDLHDVLEHTLNLAQHQLKQLNIVLQSKLNAPRNRILGNRDLLVQVFLNFYLNAIDAMEESGVLRIYTENVVVPTGVRDLWGQAIVTDHIRVIIQDSGKGLSAEALTHMFDPFYTTKTNGTGLGLSVAHGIIQEHSGAIDVESTLGIGTTFSVVLPLTTEDAEK